MRIKYLELRNYRKFEHVKLEMPDGVIGIIGSNGVGKSTLVESIAWALFGNKDEIVRGSKESVRRAGIGTNEPTKVRLEFSYANDDYSITREMSGKALSMDATLEVNGKLVARGANEVTKEIEKRLGMDYKSFFISVFARQKELAALSSLKDAERRDLIVRMLRIDRLDDIISEISAEERRQKARIEDIGAELIDEQGRRVMDSLSDQRISLERQRDENDRNIAMLRKSQEKLKAEESELDGKIDALDRKLRALIETENSLKIKHNTLNAKKRELERTIAELGEATKAKVSVKELEEIRPKIEKLAKGKEALLAARKDHERLIALTQQIENTRGELRQIEIVLSTQENAIKRLKEESKGLENAKHQEEQLRSDLENLRDKASAVKESERTLEKEIQKDKKHLKEIRELGPNSKCPTCERLLGEHYGELKERLEKGIAKGETELYELRKELKNLENEISTKDEQLAIAKKRIDQLIGLERDIVKAESIIKLKEKEKENISDRLEKMLSEMKELEEKRFDQKQLDELLEQLAELERRRDQLLSDAALAKRTPDLERRMTELTNEISGLEREISTIRYEPAEKELLESNLDELREKKAGLRTQYDAGYEKLLQLTREKEAAVSELHALERELTRLKEAERRLKGLEEERAYTARLQEIVKGFREHLISRIVPTLSQIASELLSQMTDGKYRTLMLDGGYNISIEDSGEVHRIERFSGGETDLANLCLRLAISRVIAERTYTEGINLLVLDEIFGSQDSARKRLLLSAFNGLSGQFKQIFLITHIEDVKDQLGAILEVYEDERGVSHVRMGS
ncbi:MAG: SMC family ATPase [Thermoplasmata archaeon]